MTEQHNDPYRPVKLTITYSDGHSETHDIFIAVVASGLIPCSVDEGRVAYMAQEEGFHVSGTSHIAATTEVIAAMITGFFSLIEDVLESSSGNTAAAIELAQQILSMGYNKTTLFNESEVIRKDPRVN